MRALWLPHVVADLAAARHFDTVRLGEQLKLGRPPPLAVEMPAPAGATVMVWSGR
jgi:hypothetical protein